MFNKLKSFVKKAVERVTAPFTQRRELKRVEKELAEDLEINELSAKIYDAIRIVDIDEQVKILEKELIELSKLKKSGKYQKTKIREKQSQLQIKISNLLIYKRYIEGEIEELPENPDFYQQLLDRLINRASYDSTYRNDMMSKLAGVMRPNEFETFKALCDELTDEEFVEMCENEKTIIGMLYYYQELNLKNDHEREENFENYINLKDEFVMNMATIVSSYKKGSES